LSASVFAFPLRNSGPQPWTNDELAELYRVVEILGRAGLAVETDMGMSDEGDPWFVFCRRDSGDVIAHFARIGGNFVAASIAVDETFRGANFRQIVERMVESQPLIVPPPGSGTRLLSHPVVILTAFVATALAHSEKLLASDSMRAVEAQWEHHKPADDGSAAVRHGKPGWLDSLQALLKLPATDKQHAHDASNKEGQALSLASLIAIAMTALQPVVDKVTAISHVVAEELSGQAHAASNADAAHAAQAALDLPVVDGGHDNNGVSATVAVRGDDAPQSHKIAAADIGADAQKVVIDQSAHSAAAPVSKAAAGDDAVHSASAPVETQPDGNAVFLAMQQTKLAVAVSTAETAIHVDNSSASAPMPVITIDEVSQQALQVLHIGKNNVPDSGSATIANGNPAAPPPVTTPAQVAVDQTINVDTTSGTDVINAISKFVTSNAHAIAQQITASATLEQDLAPFFGNSASLKVIAFESTSAMPDVFAFAPGVVFVDDKLLSAAQLNNQSGNLILDVSGGTVTLVGVTTIGHTAV
jgi:hypothetical protein